MLYTEEINTLLDENAAQINSMPDEQQQRFHKGLKQLEKKKKHYYKLEEALEQELSVVDLNQTHTNLCSIKKEIAEIESILKKLLSHCLPPSEIDALRQKALSLSRQGTISIRPPKGKPYSAPATRKTKSNPI